MSIGKYHTDTQLSIKNCQLSNIYSGGWPCYFILFSYVYQKYATQTKNIRIPVEGETINRLFNHISFTRFHQF